jgi:glycerophosphoryl diester phosphodiesterase
MAMFGPGLTLVGHRGAGRSNAQVGENTPSSFQLANQLGITWIEMDVRKAADGEIVVYHDEILPDGISTARLESGALKHRDIWTPAKGPGNATPRTGHLRRYKELCG